MGVEKTRNEDYRNISHTNKQKGVLSVLVINRKPFLVFEVWILFHWGGKNNDLCFGPLHKSLNESKSEKLLTITL